MPDGTVSLALERSGILPAARESLATLEAEGILLDPWAMPLPQPPHASGGGDTHAFDLQAAVCSGVSLRHRRRGWTTAPADGLVAALPASERSWCWSMD